MRKLNIFTPEFDHSSERPTYRWRGARVGKAIGGQEIGACLFVLPAEERTSTPITSTTATRSEWVTDGRPHSPTVFAAPGGERASAGECGDWRFRAAPPVPTGSKVRAPS